MRAGLRTQGTGKLSDHVVLNRRDLRVIGRSGFRLCRGAIGRARTIGAVSTAAASSRDAVFERVEQAVEAGVRRFDLSRFRDTLKGDDAAPIGLLIADFGTQPRWRRKRPCCLVAVEIDGDEIKQSRRHDPNKTGPLADRQARAETVDSTGSGGKQGFGMAAGISARSPPPSSGVFVTTRTALSPSIWIEVRRSPTAGK